MSKRLVILIALCGALYLIGNGRVPLWDRDEPRYAQASRQMLQSGDWVVPKLLDEPRINKPPLIYWLQAASMRTFQTIWPDAGLSIQKRMQRDAAAARFPSSLAMTLTLILIACAMMRMAGEERAFWTTLIFGTSGLVIMAAKMCLTDAVLLLFVTGSQLCLYAMWQNRASWPVVVVFAICTGLGLLTKGPVILGINGTTLAILAILALLDRWSNRQERAPGFEVISSHDKSSDSGPALDYSEREESRVVSLALGVLKAAVVVGIAAAIFLPWVILMHHRIPGGLEVTFRHDVLDRMTHPLEQHKGPPGYYLLFFLISFFPWSLLLPTTINAWQMRREPLIRFSFAAAVGPWLMFECIATKLPHYVLPCFPCLAILTGETVIRSIYGELNDWRRRGWLIAVGIWSIAVIAAGSAPWLAASKRFAFDPLPYTAMIAVTLASLIVAVIVFIQFSQRRIAFALIQMAAGMFILIALLFGLYLPRADFLHLSENVGSYLQSIGATEKGNLYIDYKEDSLPFYQGGTIRPQGKNTYLAVEPPEKWPRYLVITREIWEAAPDSARARLEILKTFRGWAYAAKGRVVEVLVVRKR